MLNTTKLNFSSLLIKLWSGLAVKTLVCFDEVPWLMWALMYFIQISLQTCTSWQMMSKPFCWQKIIILFFSWHVIFSQHVIMTKKQYMTPRSIKKEKNEMFCMMTWCVIPCDINLGLHVSIYNYKIKNCWG
jgi:hypothetical protein